MSNNNSYNDHFLKEEELLAFIKGEVSTEEKERIANIISNNEFMRDAYEGLLASNLNKVANTQESIHLLIKKEINKTNKKHIKIFQNNIWIIALLLILCIITIAFYIIKSMR